MSDSPEIKQLKADLKLAKREFEEALELLAQAREDLAAAKRREAGG